MNRTLVSPGKIISSLNKNILIIQFLKPSGKKYSSENFVFGNKGRIPEDADDQIQSVFCTTNYFLI